MAAPCTKAGYWYVIQQSDIKSVVFNFSGKPCCSTNRRGIPQWLLTKPDKSKLQPYGNFPKYSVRRNIWPQTHTTRAINQGNGTFTHAPLSRKSHLFYMRKYLTQPASSIIPQCACVYSRNLSRQFLICLTRRRIPESFGHTLCQSKGDNGRHFYQSAPLCYQAKCPDGFGYSGVSWERNEFIVAQLKRECASYLWI